MFAPVLNNLVAIATFVGYAMLRSAAAPSVDQITTLEKTVLGAGTTLGVVAMTRGACGRRCDRSGSAGSSAAAGATRPCAAWASSRSGSSSTSSRTRSPTWSINILAGGIGEGRFQVYATAFIVFPLPHAIFAVSIFTALLPGMSEQWTDGRPAGVRRACSPAACATRPS